MQSALFTKAQRQQALADMLAGRAIQGNMPVHTGAVAPQMGVGHGLTQLAAAMLSKRQGKKADATLAQANEERKRMMAEALAGNPEAGNLQAMIESGVDPAIVGEMATRGRQTVARPPSSVSEYEYAKTQGFNGSYADFMQSIKRSPGTTVNLKNEGQIPTGYSAKRDAQGNIVSYEPIPGGPAAQEAEAAEMQAQNRQAATAQQSNVIVEEIDRALTVLNDDGNILPETGALGALAGKVPGTDANRVANNLKTIQANIGFEELNEMRQNSPTGGALGNVTVKEIERLEAIQGSLTQAQNATDLQYNLIRYRNAMMDIIHGPEAARAMHLPLPELFDSSKGPKVGEVVDGYMYAGGDPSKESSWRRQ